MWIPSHNVGIELNGIYWHKEKFAGTISHYDKWITAQKVGIQLLQIWEDDWKYKPDLIKRILAHKFKFEVAQKLFSEENRSHSSFEEATEILE